MSIPKQYTPTTLTERDIIEWSEFCAECFSYKVNPPSSHYFQRHFYNDPYRDTSLIHVMRYQKETSHHDNSLNKESEIVSSVRVFQRTISLGRKGVMANAGGIGEVCTHIHHQRKGLAKHLLQFALQRIQENDEWNMQVSFLHASPQLTKVYESSAGYKSVVSHWSVLPSVECNPTAKAKMQDHIQIRLAVFPHDTLALQQIHEEYSQDRLAGCIIRTPEYWNEYLSKEIGDSLFVLTLDLTIVAWMSIRTRSENRFQLREYGIVNATMLEQLELTNTEVFSLLLERALKQQQQQQQHHNHLSEKDVPRDTVEFQLPTFVLKELQNTCLENDGKHTGGVWIDFCNPMIYSEDDHGWMYKSLLLRQQQLKSNSSHDNVHPQSIFDIVEKKGVPHLIWPSDSF